MYWYNVFWHQDLHANVFKLVKFLFYSYYVVCFLATVYAGE